MVEGVRGATLACDLLMLWLKYFNNQKNYNYETHNNLYLFAPWGYGTWFGIGNGIYSEVGARDAQFGGRLSE